MSTFHPQVVIEHDGISASVDEAMAPIIIALWRLGFTTISSCENDPNDDPPGASGIAYIGFPSCAEAERAQALIPYSRLLDITKETYGSPESYEAGYSVDGMGAVVFETGTIPLIARALCKERGQIIVVALLAMVSLLGMGALVVDVGSWYQAKRHDQACADAAVLAAAQVLPDAFAATAMARDYAGRNGCANTKVQIRSIRHSQDAVFVTVKQQAPTFFARVVGLQTVAIGAKAEAWSQVPASVRYAQNLGVDAQAIQLFGFGTQMQLSLCTGRRQGLACTLNISTDQALGTYNQLGTGFSGDLLEIVGKTVVAPVYVRAGLQYRVISWVALSVTDVDLASSRITGTFIARYLAQGDSTRFDFDPQPPDYGLRVVRLIQ